MKKTVLLLAVAAWCVTAGAAEKIGALGRIIPAGDLINLVGPGDAIGKVMVAPDALVEAGTPLVEFSGLAGAEHDVTLAELALREADELGQRSVEALEQKELLARHDDEFAQKRLARFDSLGGDSISAQQMEMRTYQAKNAELTHRVAAKELERGRLDREIKIARAKEQLEIARARRSAYRLCAPERATVVKLGGVPGEVPAGPAVVLAAVDRMQVVAEVFAGDLLKLKAGQKATVTSSALPAPMTGRVLSVSRLITGRSKVAEALIELDDPATAARLLNLEVNVSIEL